MKKISKKVIALVMAIMLVVGILTGCGSSPQKSENQNAEPVDSGEQQKVTEDGKDNAVAKSGKILVLVAAGSGPGFDFTMKYMEMWEKELGYDIEVIFADSANDPAGNLTAVRNAMTKDVIGLVAIADGGLIDIMTEYPDLYVVGTSTDMASVFSEGGASAACLDKEKFLGTIAGGYADGTNIGKMMAEATIEKGYKKVAICIAPAFAYPQYSVADKVYREEIERYNETAAEKIEIVDPEPTVLMFKPLDDTFFNEPHHQDLDVVIGFCAGQAFIYPVLANAIGNGVASADTHILTFGLEGDQTLIDDVGAGIVQGLYVPSFEATLYSIVLLDNAIQGKQFADFEKPEVLDSPYVHITSDEIMTNIEENSPMLNQDMSKLAVSVEDAKQYFTRFNPDATYANLVELMESDALTEKAYEK